MSPVPLGAMLVLSTGIAGGPPRPVGDFGGRWVGGSEIRVFDASVPAIHRIDRRTLGTTVLPLTGSDSALDPYGMALPGDGTVWVLGDRGRIVHRFSEATGEHVEKRRLTEPSQGILTLWRQAGFFAVRLRPGEPLLLRAANGKLRPFSSLLSRNASDVTDLLIANLIRCGSGTRRALPCWFTAGDPEVLLLDRNGALRRVPVPSFVTPLAASRPKRPPGSEFTFPVRDAFLLESGALWVLANQEGDRTPLEEGSVRGRHAALVRPGHPQRVVALPSEGRAILDATEQGLVVLLADGVVARVAAR
jgi:hypothetical protein